MGRFLIGLDATHAGIRSSVRSTVRYQTTSPLQGTLPYHATLTCSIRGFGGWLEPRYIVGAAPLDQ